MRSSVVLLLLACLIAPARADEPADPRAAKSEAEAKAAREAERAGRALFQRAVTWMRGTGARVETVTTAHLRFADVKLDDEPSREGGRHHEGHLELWFQAPDKFREIWRTSSQDTHPTIKVLDGGRAWIRTPAKPDWQRQHGAGGTGAGSEAIAQMQRDARQIADLARFLSPASLDGKRVVWTRQGLQRLPAPLATPTTAALHRVRRTAPGEPTMLFFFAEAPVAAPAASTPAAPKTAPGLWPHAVGIQADPAAKQRREWFVLDRWRRTSSGRARPARIQGYAPGPGGALERFILLFPESVELNRTLPAGVFQPGPLAAGSTPPGKKPGR